MTSKFETKIRKLANEREHTVSDGSKIFHKKDVAEVPNSVANNQVDSQAREIAQKVKSQLKNVKRGKGGRFTGEAQPGRTEEVKAKGGRKIQLETSDSDEEALAKVKRQKRKPAKYETTSATRTETTPPVSPSKSQTSGKGPQSPMDTSTMFSISYS